MAVLADRTIQELLARQELVIDPRPPDKAFQPASIDLHLASDFRDYSISSRIDLANVKMTAKTTANANWQRYILEPHEFVLGRTIEHIQLPPNLVGRIEGKSSLGRLGLSIHATAGFIDPGFEGTITLEITNDNVVPIILRPGQAICQLSLMTLTDTVKRPYGHPDLKSKYQGQTSTTESRYEG